MPAHGREVTASPETLLTALRLSAGSPGAAEALLQEEHWAQRLGLCQLSIQRCKAVTGWLCYLR